MSNLNPAQLARVSALDAAHLLLSGRSGASVLAQAKRDGLLTSEVPQAVAVAEYVLTGDYQDPDADTSGDES